ncbi:MAG: hypothetical protein MZV49_16945 [Rhodopseudomonas palustris]|nr:hypothetical protein [Rhodopseudomonas palustris]
MLALGWGLAAAIGAVAGMMVAPVVFLDPNMMAGILLYGFAAAAARRASTSPFGAVIGGFHGRHLRKPGRHLHSRHRQRVETADRAGADHHGAGGETQWPVWPLCREASLSHERIAGQRHPPPGRRRSSQGQHRARLPHLHHGGRSCCSRCRFLPKTS